MTLAKELPSGWINFKVTELFETITPKHKLNVKFYLKQGNYPVVDQSDNFISGYHNQESYVNKISNPVIIFGDHTRIFKYVQFNFISGADGTKILSPNLEIVNPKFLFYGLKNINLISEGYSRHFRILKKSELSIPPLDVQERIVQILDKAERLKELREQSIKKSEELELSIFSEFITNNSEKLPPHWKLSTLGEKCDFIGGGTPSKNEMTYWTDGFVPWASVRDIDGKYLKSTEYKITEKAISSSSTNLIEKNNVILVTRVGLGKVCMNQIDVCINQDLKAVIPKDGTLLKTYLLYFLIFKSKFIENLGRGATVKGVTLEMVKNIKIIIPPLIVQKDLVEKINKASKIFDKSTNYETEQLASSLLQRAFSGEI